MATVFHRVLNKLSANLAHSGAQNRAHLNFIRYFFVSRSFIIWRNLSIVKHILLSVIPQVLNNSANYRLNISTNEKCKNICVLHMTV